MGEPAVCNVTQVNGAICPRAAKVRLRPNGSMYWAYACNSHVNQRLRELLKWDSPRILEVGCLL